MSFARFASIGSALVVAMILTRILDQDTFGAYRKLWLVYGVLGPALINSIANTLYYRGTSENQRAVLGVNLLLGFSYGIVVAAAAYFPASFWASWLNVPELTQGFQNFALYMGLAVFAGMAESIFVVLKRKKWLINYSFAYNVFESLLIILPFVYGLPIPQVMLIMAIGPALRTLIILSVVMKESDRLPTLSEIRLEFPLSFRYGLGIMALSFVGMASLVVDKWVVGIFIDSDALYATYEIGAKKIPFITAFASAVGAGIVAEYASRFKIKDYTKALSEIRQASGRLFVTIIPVVVILLIFAEEILLILFGGYQESAPIFRIYLFTILTQLVFPQSVVLGVGKSKIVALYSLFELIFNLGLSLILIQYIGILGPAIATLAAHILFVALLFGYCHYKLGISPSQFKPGSGTKHLLWILPTIFGIGYGLKWVLDLSIVGLIITTVFTGLILLFARKKIL